MKELIERFGFPVAVAVALYGLLQQELVSSANERARQAEILVQHMDRLRQACLPGTQPSSLPQTFPRKSTFAGNIAAAIGDAITKDEPANKKARPVVEKKP